MSTLDLLPGTLFAEDFQIVRRLGVGDSGAVFVAEHISTGVQRALKVMAPQVAPDEQARLAFEREARVGAQIESDHIVLVVAAGLDSKTRMAWLAMELLDGVDLAARFARGIPLPSEEVRHLFAQLCGALGQAHDVGITHGDLKPTNVFLARPTHADAPFDVKVLDFGVARLTFAPDTAAAGFLGTPLWMAPEQTRHDGGPVVPATDVWALGLMAFWALTGKSYWLAAKEPQTDLVALAREITIEPLESASDRAARLGLRTDFPPGFDAWLKRCLARDANQRFANARDAHVTFGEILGQSTRPPAHALPAGPQPARSAPPPEWLASTQNRQQSDLEWFSANAPPPPAPPAPALGPMAADGPGFLAAVPSAPPAIPWASRKSRAAGRVAVAMIGALAFVGGGAALAWLRPWRPSPVPLPGWVTPSAPPVASPASVAPPAAAPPSDSVDVAAAQHAVDEVRSHSPLIEIAGGSFTPGTWGGLPDERPGARTKLAPFGIEQHEVTVEDYAACVVAGRCSPPARGNMCLGNSPKHARSPVNCVSWTQARTYCGWLGRRLPSEFEWERAAGGPEKRVHPWPRATAPSDTDLCWQRSGTSAGPCEVGSFPRGNTPEGLADMAGDVWEWTSSAYCPYDKPDCDSSFRVTRGGGWCDADPSLFRTTARQANDPEQKSDNIGFRCASDR